MFILMTPDADLTSFRMPATLERLSDLGTAIELPTCDQTVPASDLAFHARAVGERITLAAVGPDIYGLGQAHVWTEDGRLLRGFAKHLLSSDALVSLERRTTQIAALRS